VVEKETITAPESEIVGPQRENRPPGSKPYRQAFAYVVILVWVNDDERGEANETLKRLSYNQMMNNRKKWGEGRREREVVYMMTCTPTYLLSPRRPAPYPRAY
jgi:lysyl-tRNA synthetase class I